MTTPTPAASATLANGCVVRVGDVVPMTDGEVRTVESIAPDALRLQMLRRVNIAHLYDKGGVRISDPDHPARIDLAKLAEQQAATAQPAGATVREMVERLKNRIDTRLNNHLVDMRKGWDDSVSGFNDAWDIVRKVFSEHAAELAAALPSGMTEGQVDRALKAFKNEPNNWMHSTRHAVGTIARHPSGEIVDTGGLRWDEFVERQQVIAALRAAGLLGGKDA